MTTTEITFRDIVVEHCGAKVVLEYIGEGLEGDYDPEDSDDTPLIRFTVFKNNEQVEDASYCTTLSVHTDRIKLQKVAEHILETVFLSVMHNQPIKKMCENLSHIRA